ncbi:nucleoid-associated protein [Listeria ilorinensis]|uniref:nucleoid-associated protein n=1 Tax=Listeria ilorinensis TaxID=2867439 RepID=UPI001EF6C110|nr:nucleoid-associated protein [Listeria ilorinensis]
MPDFSYAKINQLVVHFVGNKAQEDGYEAASNVLSEIGSDLNFNLGTIFFEPFTKENYYHFTHESELSFNEVYTYSRNIFNDPEQFLEDSTSILKHLYSESTHPNIKSGDLWIFTVENVIVEGEMTSGIGIFKVENKEIFLKNDFQNAEFEIGYDKGINGTDLDKGCFIFDLDQETGGKLLILDRLNKNDSIYWKDRFLNVEQTADERFYTESFVNICTDYIKQKEESLIEKSNFVKATSEYLLSGAELDIDDFAEKTLEKPYEQAEFKTVVENFERENNIQFPEKFDLDEEKVEKLSKKIRKTLKLGRNMSLVIKDLEQLEESDFVQGYDEQKGKHFMIVYYD